MLVSLLLGGLVEGGLVRWIVCVVWLGLASIVVNWYVLFQELRSHARYEKSVKKVSVFFKYHDNNEICLIFFKLKTQHDGE